MAPRVLITGANGHLGQRLIERIGETQAVRAVVRSKTAAEQLERSLAEEVRVLDYADAGALTRAAEGCSHAVHLVGIIKETRSSDYATAHETTTAALSAAAEAAGIQRIVYLSILGAHAGSGNRCLASKARGEAVLLGGRVPTVVLRVPMVLGEGDYASAALARKRDARLAFTFRADSLEQPIYVGDVVEAIVASLARSGAENEVYDLAGPESLSRRALFARAGFSGQLVSLPLGLGTAVAALLERTMANPPVTRDMLGVLDHDDAIESSAAYAALGIAPTGLDDMLARVMGPGGPS